MPVHDWTRVVPGVFHDFHHGWISAISRKLNTRSLETGFYSLIENSDQNADDDLRFPARKRTADGTDRNTLAVLDHPPEVKYTEELEREIYAESANRVAVYHASGDRIVAFIEIVSPGNKHSEYELKRFLDKLSESLDRGLHLLIVDVFPPGPFDPRGIHAAFWGLRSSEAHGVTPEEPLGLSAYRSDVKPTAYFQPFAVHQPLVEMPIFLTPDLYVNVPLEETYLAAWRGVPSRWKRVIEGQAGE